MLCSSCRDILKFIAYTSGLIFLFYAIHFFQENVTVKYETDIKDVLQLAITAVFGSITVLFSYYAYSLNRERFRLDLFEKRWPIYEEALKFCSTVLAEGGIPSHSDRPENQDRNKRAIEALNSAHNSFRGLGYHKTRSLFGKDIENYFEKINKSFCWLASHNNFTEVQQPGISEEWSKHVGFIIEATEKLPDIFRPYIYFGDYKKDL